MMESHTTISTLNAYRVKQKVANRTLTVELPEEFEDAEVEVVVLKETVSAPKSKEEKLAAVRRFKGIVKPPFYEPTEDEWYLQ